MPSRMQVTPPQLSSSLPTGKMGDLESSGSAVWGENSVPVVTAGHTSPGGQTPPRFKEALRQDCFTSQLENRPT